MNGDWALVRAVIDIEAAYQRLTQSDLCTASGVDRTVLHNLGKGRSASDATLRRIESALGLPRLFLHYVATHDTEAVEAAGAEQDLIRLVLHKIDEADQQTNLN